MTENHTTEMPLLDHLRELRRHLVRAVIGIAIGVAIVSPFASTLYTLLMTPLASQLPLHSGFVTLGVMEGWSVYFKVAMISGLFLSSPFWLYEIWSFVAPGLKTKEHRLIIVAGGACALCFILGGYFAYALVLPWGFHFFLQLLEGTDITLMPQMNLYLSSVLTTLLGFGIVFQLPVAMVLAVRWNVVELATLTRYRRYMIVAAFVVAAVLTPPDVLSQIMMALPLVLLYEVGILVARMGAKSSRHTIPCNSREKAGASATAPQP